MPIPGHKVFQCKGTSAKAPRQGRHTLLFKELEETGGLEQRKRAEGRRARACEGLSRGDT